jgi:DNA-binding CsgD family transcriptional regulator
VLVGRAESLARLDWVVSGAKAGRGGALVLRGEPGSGKTALLAAAAERAGGMTVLRCLGAQDERELPYAGLHALLRRLGQHRDDLIPAQRVALDRALGNVSGGRPSPLLVAAAFLALLDAAADEAPVLVLVDDLQWVDHESRDVIGFVARRVTDSAVGLVLAMRADSLAIDGVEVLDIHDLDRATAVDLLAGHGVRRSVADRLVDAVGGNPLALLELAHHLDDGQRSGDEPLPDPLPATSPSAAYSTALAGLPESARLAAGAAAVAGPVQPPVLAEALSRLGTDHDRLAQVEATGLLSLTSEGVSWRHPLARSAASDALGASDRRRCHRAVAEALAQANGEPATIVWHRVEAATGPDEALACDLEAVADVSANRGAHRAASRAWETAARLGTDHGATARRLGEAGLAAWLGDDAVSARRLIAQALPDVADPELRWELAWTAGHVVAATGTPQQTWDAFMAAVAEARTSGRRDHEVQALANAFNSSLHLDDAGRIDRLVAELTAAVDPADPVQVARCHAVQGFALLNADHLEAGRAQLEQAMTGIEQGDLLDTHPDLLQMTVQAVMWSGQHRRMRLQIERTIDQLKSAGDTRMLTSTVRGLAWCDYAAGPWGSAALLADEALDLARIGGRATDICDSLILVATLEAVRGHPADAVRHAREAYTVATPLDAPWREAEALWCELLAALSAHDIDALVPPTDALTALLLARRVSANQPEYLDAPLALAILGRRDEASALLDQLLDGVGQDARRETRVGETLCRCALGPDDPALATAAADLAESMVDDEYVFGRGRLRLAAGSMKRRLGRRVEARRLLRGAESDFGGLGAAPWLARTRDELRASGATLRSAANPEDTLTAAEARVARAAAVGLSNKEIAASLFLSPKTVEFHLGRIFRKLQVRSRAELVRVVLTGPYAPESERDD